MAQREVLRRRPGGFVHYCPGCRTGHFIPTDPPFTSAQRHTYCGPADRPSFVPSVRVRDAGGAVVCHYFIVAGVIRFCMDSAHALAGSHVPLPACPEDVTYSDARRRPFEV